MKNYGLYVLLGMMFALQPIAAEASETGYLKKTGKIVWHVAEVYAAWIQLCRYQTRPKDSIVSVVTIVSLGFHGLCGLNKELKIVKTLKEFIK